MVPDPFLKDKIPVNDQNLPILSPDLGPAEVFTDPAAAVTRLEALYAQATAFLAEHFNSAVTGKKPDSRVRAFYPEIRLTTTSFAKTDSRLSFGHVAEPGTYSTTVTRPDLFRNYLIQQIGLLIQNHGVPVMIGAVGYAHPRAFRGGRQPRGVGAAGRCVGIQPARCV